MSHTPSTPAELEAFLATHADWTHDDNALRRAYRFDDFVAAFGWMTQVALVAERMGHHPEWRNVWASVDVRLCTHDAGDVVTQLDLDLAATMETFATPLLGDAETTVSSSAM